MAGGKLEVQIGGDISDLQKKIKEAEFNLKELSQFKLDRLKLGLDTTEINGNIKSVKQELSNLRTIAKDTGNTLGGQFAQKTANGSNALLQFSRIAQDAPFGIIGIGNNITATVESFGYLKQATGSTGGALKALGQSIVGSGGILLGVSLLTTGLTLLAQSGLTVGDVVDKITGNFDEFGRALSKANEEAVKNSAAEISGLNALVSVAKNVNLSMRDRLTAVNELQKSYPGYFGNLSEEEILNGNVANAVKSVTNALIAKARAKAYTDELVKLSQEQFKIEEKLLSLLTQQEKLREQSASKNAVALKATGKNQDFVINAAIRNTKAIADLDNQINDYSVQLEKNAFLQQKWTDRINENVAANIKFREEVAKPVKSKIFNTPQVSGVTNNIIPAPLFDTLGIEVFNGQVDAFGNKVKELPNKIKTSLSTIPNVIDEASIQMVAALLDFNNRASEIVSGAIADTFANVGSAIGNALASGGSVLQAIGASLLDSLGSLLVQMGKMAIQVGVGLLAIKLALKSLNPAVAIGAGVALVALGSFFSSKSKSIGNSIGGGGGVSGGSGSGANNQSFSSSGFTSRGDGGGTVVFEISGQKLIGVLSNTINSNRRLGGTLGLG